MCRSQKNERKQLTQPLWNKISDTSTTTVVWNLCVYVTGQQEPVIASIYLSKPLVRLSETCCFKTAEWDRISVRPSLRGNECRVTRPRKEDIRTVQTSVPSCPQDAISTCRSSGASGTWRQKSSCGEPEVFWVWGCVCVSDAHTNLIPSSSYPL